jgi:putative ABC transport system ATP-binding protein
VILISPLEVKKPAVPHNLITLENVSFHYPDGRTVLKDINLEINKNDIVVIKGESGAGKSTFLKLFNRFCDCTGGRVLFHGKALTEYAIDRLRGSILYLPQLPFVIDGTVEDNLSFPFSFHVHSDKRFSEDKAGEWLHYFQLDLPMNHDASQLSVGQKQRVALIRTLLLEPEVLLLDEPGSALDSSNKQLIEQKVEHLTDSSGITVIMATHSDVGFSGDTYREYMLTDHHIVQHERHGR